MTNPNEELLKSIKSLLDKHREEITAEAEHKVTSVANTLRQEMKEQTQTVLRAIKALRDETVEVIGDLANQIATQKEVDGLTQRVEKLEHLQKTS